MRKRGLPAAVSAMLGMSILALGVLAGPASARTYTRPPSGLNQWFWEIDPSSPGVGGLPATSGAYPSPGSADIWDTDLFQDSNAPNAGIPTGPSPVVEAIHAAGHYSICYVEAGAYQVGFPDDSNFAVADYGGVGDRATQMQGYSDEYWFDLTGFANYVAGQPGTLSGAAVDIAAQLNKRFAWCKLEGQDAVEPDDLDGYTNKSTSGVTPWGLTQADSAGFERWLAYDIHANGLAAFEKNDPANEPQDASLFDGMIIEECNYYNDPCSGPGGDASAYLAAGKPVLNAEYTQDGETTAKFCSADIAAGIAGALFDVNLSGGTYQPCAPANATSSPPPVSPQPPPVSPQPPPVSPPSPPVTPAPPVSPQPPVNTRLPVLHGTAKQGDTLSVSTGSWSNSPTGYAYHWQVCVHGACSTVAGATGSSFKLTAGDVGATIDALVTATNGGGSASATSAASTTVTGTHQRQHTKKSRRADAARKPGSADRPDAVAPLRVPAS